MRKLAVVMLTMAALLTMTRLFTGIYYITDDAQAYLVLKQRPDLAIERTRVDDAEFDRVRILDADELDLAYGDLYRGTMAAVPAVVLALTVGCLLVLRRRAA